MTSFSLTNTYFASLAILDPNQPVHSSAKRLCSSCLDKSNIRSLLAECLTAHVKSVLPNDTRLFLLACDDTGKELACQPNQPCLALKDEIGRVANRVPASRTLAVVAWVGVPHGIVTHRAEFVRALGDVRSACKMVCPALRWMFVNLVSLMEIQKFGVCVVCGSTLMSR